MYRLIFNFNLRFIFICGDNKMTDISMRESGLEPAVPPYISTYHRGRTRKWSYGMEAKRFITSDF